MNNISLAHCFALFYDKLSAAPSITITDQELIHRVSNVLRLQRADRIVLFNAHMHANATITSLSKKECTVHILNHAANKTLSPFITVLLPVIKRAAYEQALYLATELGANAIQLVTTAKTQPWRTSDYARAQRILIAAAEQSKQFSIPTFHEPIALNQLSTLAMSTLLVADINGEPIRTVIDSLKKPAHLHLLVGPEGDFTAQEYADIATLNAHHCALTPTILRTEHAMALLLGICRSFLQ